MSDWKSAMTQKIGNWRAKCNSEVGLYENVSKRGPKLLCQVYTLRDVER